ncbi:carbonate dehydratase [Tumebacillus lipolyticus]|uniref:Carbonate dehydratase n=1 Tax=Tumebacillus lipolyticus TaxID=1280370 RepID=A0ABW4ZW12_9BACL
MTKEMGIYPLHQILVPNPPVEEVPAATDPAVSERAVIGVGSIIIGAVCIADDVFVGFYNLIRADSSPPFSIGARSNIQDFVAIHCHPAQYVEVEGKRYGVYVEEKVSILHHAVVHGPLYIGRNTFIGQSASINGAVIEQDCVIMHGAVVTGLVRIAAGRYVAPGQSVFTQEQADRLPPVPERYRQLNGETVDHYVRLGKSYAKQGLLTL